jgi:hypothetical protein
VTKFCCLAVVLVAFLAVLVWQRRRLMDRDRDDRG